MLQQHSEYDSKIKITSYEDPVDKNKGPFLCHSSTVP